MESDTQVMDEIVVTALGIRTEKKALGYSTSEVKSDALTATKTNTFPRRNPYPPDEIEKNASISALGQPDYFKKGTAWDTKPFSWRSGTK